MPKVLSSMALARPPGLVVSYLAHPNESLASDVHARRVVKMLRKMGHDVVEEPIDIRDTFWKKRHAWAAKYWTKPIPREVFNQGHFQHLSRLLKKYPERIVLDFHNFNIKDSLQEFKGADSLVVSRELWGYSPCPHVHSTCFANMPRFKLGGEFRRVHAVEIAAPFEPRKLEFWEPEWSDQTNAGFYLKNQVSLSAARRLGLASVKVSRRIAEYLDRQARLYGFEMPRVTSVSSFVKLVSNPDFQSIGAQAHLHKQLQDLVENKKVGGNLVPTVNGKPVSENQRTRIVRVLTRWVKRSENPASALLLAYTLGGEQMMRGMHSASTWAWKKRNKI